MLKVGTIMSDVESEYINVSSFIENHLNILAINHLSDIRNILSRKETDSAW